MQNPASKFTLKDWVRHPTTILLVVVTALAWGLLWVYVQSQLQQVEYLKSRVAKLEEQVDEYTKTVLFKEAKEKSMKEVIISQKIEIDSLKQGGAQ